MSDDIRQKASEVLRILHGAENFRPLRQPKRYGLWIGVEIGATRLLNHLTPSGRI
jgi:hypothetical protein